MSKWHITVAVAFVTQSGGIRFDAYSKKVEGAGSIPEAVNEMIGAAIAENYRITAVTVIPCL